ncbi:MAG TPA: hypothetical protein VGR56_06325 [Nitrososphaerales archaeon]|nr:hypothetical protein [Nitrososphaerales archaeon]
MTTIPRTPFGAVLRRRRSTASSSTAKTELMASYLQEIIEDAVQVGWLSGYSPHYILQNISEAMQNDKDLKSLAKLWLPDSPSNPEAGH